jgi:hypothetical protein
VTAPSDITINGYAGKTFQRTAPADFTGCNPGQAAFRSWSSYQGDVAYQPNETETLLVLDLNGSIILINTRGTDRQDSSALAGLTAVRDTIRIEQP